MTIATAFQDNDRNTPSGRPRRPLKTTALTTFQDDLIYTVMPKSCYRHAEMSLLGISSSLSNAVMLKSLYSASQYMGVMPRRLYSASHPLCFNVYLYSAVSPQTSLYRANVPRRPSLTQYKALSAFSKSSVAVWPSCGKTEMPWLMLSVTCSPFV